MPDSSLESLVSSLSKYKLRLEWRNPDLPTNIRLGDGITSLLLEAKEGSAENTLAAYQRVDGTQATISVLTPTELLKRKMEAYEGRRLIRDIYDIFLLSNFLDRYDYTVKTSLSYFLNNLSEPEDEEVLRSLIIKGKRDLGFSQMTDYLRRWLNEI